jgi:uncharacterized protein YajQ (UPF0234 family)
MATTFSFDIVSNYDVSEMNNAIDQADRELANRDDFKGTKAALAFRDATKSGLTITGDNEYHIEAILDIIRKKLATRGVSLKVLDTSKTPVTSNLKVTLDVPFRKGLDQEKAKKLTNTIRAVFPKIKAQIQGDEVRVSGSKKDELQTVMQHLQSEDFDFPIEFTNYR